jgi:hypothetical protein
MTHTKIISVIGSLFSFIALMFALSACKNEDPKPVNEEEVITTMNVVLTPSGGGDVITLKFQDLDGDGSAVPVKTVSGPLRANKTYMTVITLQDESGSGVEDITKEVKAESEAHLFCFVVTGSNLAITPTDTDSNNLPIGLSSSWVTSIAGSASVTISLRHQPGTKTGACPGTGETDVEVNFSISVQ